MACQPILQRDSCSSPLSNCFGRQAVCWLHCTVGSHTSLHMETLFLQTPALLTLDSVKPSISTHSNLTRTRLLKCFVLITLCCKTKHLRNLVQAIIRGFEWLEIQGLWLWCYKRLTKPLHKSKSLIKSWVRFIYTFWISLSFTSSIIEREKVHLMNKEEWQNFVSKSSYARNLCTAGQKGITLSCFLRVCCAAAPASQDSV